MAFSAGLIERSEVVEISIAKALPEDAWSKQSEQSECGGMALTLSGDSVEVPQGASRSGLRQFLGRKI